MEYSVERCQDPATGAVNFEVMNSMAAIGTPGDLTVAIRMGTVNAPFLSPLAENGAGVVMPRDSGPQQGTHPRARVRSSSSAMTWWAASW